MCDVRRRFTLPLLFCACGLLLASGCRQLMPGQRTFGPNPTYAPTQQFGPAQQFGPSQTFGPGDTLHPTPDPGLQTPTEVPLEQRFYGNSDSGYLPNGSSPTPADPSLTESQRVPTPVDPLDLPGIETEGTDDKGFEELPPSDGPRLPNNNSSDFGPNDNGNGFTPRSSNNFGGGNSFADDNSRREGDRARTEGLPPILPVPDRSAPGNPAVAGETPSARIEDVTPQVIEMEISSDGATKRVGQATIFTLIITNTGKDTAEDVVVESRFDNDWTFPGRDDKLVRRPVGKLDPNEPQTVRLMLVGDADGVLCVRFSVLVGEKNVVSKQICVDYRAESARRKTRGEILPY